VIPHEQNELDIAAQSYFRCARIGLLYNRRIDYELVQNYPLYLPVRNSSRSELIHWSTIIPRTVYFPLYQECTLFLHHLQAYGNCEMV